MKRILYLLLLISTISFGQSVDGSLKTVVASGTDTYTITEGSPNTGAYVLNERFLVRFTNANTGAATLNRKAIGALAIKNTDGSELASGDITAGETKLLSYNGTYYQIVGGGASSGGTVTSVSVTTANGVSGSVASATTTPAITLTLGAITPSSIGSATTATTQSVNDNSTKIATTAYADRLTNFSTPEQFGAVRDGSTNDQVALQACVDSGKPCIAGFGNYRVTSTVTLGDNEALIGQGNGTIISTTSNISIATITGKNTTVEKLQLLGNSTGAAQTGINITGNAGLTLDYTSNRIRNVTVKDLNFAGIYGYRVVGSTGSLHQGSMYLSDIYADHCGTGIYLDDRAEYVIMTNVKAYNCVTQGVYVSGGNMSWSGGSVTDTPIGMRIVTGSNDGKGTVTGVNFNHTSTIGVSTTGVTQGFSFVNCYFAVSGVTLGTSVGMLFKNCIFSSSDVTVTNCTFTSFLGSHFRTTPTVSITGTNPDWSLVTFEAGVTPTAVGGLQLATLQSIPPSPVNGHIQYNSATGKKNVTAYTDGALSLVSKGFVRTGDNRMYSNAWVNESLSTQALGANILRAFPLIVERTIVINLFEINVTTGSGATTARFGIYTDNGNLYPDALIANTDVGTYDTSTSATFPQNTPAANVTLTPGLYWVAYNSNGGATLRATTKVPNILGSTSATANSQGMGWTVSLAYGALPSTFTAGGTILAASAVSAPLLFFRAN